MIRNAVFKKENTENINKIQTQINEAKNYIEEIDLFIENRSKEMV
jgi:hypothetical protein